MLRTIVEPFRIKSVEPIHWTTRPQREQLLRAAFYNLFLLPADEMCIRDRIWAMRVKRRVFGDAIIARLARFLSNRATTDASALPDIGLP